MLHRPDLNRVGRVRAAEQVATDGRERAHRVPVRDVAQPGREAMRRDERVRHEAERQNTMNPIAYAFQERGSRPANPDYADFTSTTRNLKQPEHQNPDHPVGIIRSSA
jgi:hypothetical protein